MKSKLSAALAASWCGLARVRLDLSILAVVLFTVVLSIAAPARADTVFDLTGTFNDGTTVSGTLTIDLTIGQIDAANLIYGSNTYSTILLQQPFTGITAPSQTPVPVSYLVHIGISSSFPRIDLAIPGTSAVNSLVSYAGGSLCSFSAPCGPDQSGIRWASAFFSSSGTGMGLQTGTYRGPRPHRWRWPTRPNPRQRWATRLVATAAERSPEHSAATRTVICGS